MISCDFWIFEIVRVPLISHLDPESCSPICKRKTFQPMNVATLIMILWAPGALQTLMQGLDTATWTKHANLSSLHANAHNLGWSIVDTRAPPNLVVIALFGNIA